MQGIIVCLLAYVWFGEGCVVRWLWLRQLRQCWHTAANSAAEANHCKHSADHTVHGSVCVDVDNLCKYAVTCMSLYLPYAVIICCHS